jgi:dihydrofolate reductase
MKTIMVAAISQDGYLTNGDDNDPSKWTSQEDKNHFAEIIKKHKLQVFGSNTYNVYEPKPSEDVLRVVLSREPKKYAEVAVQNQLEFITLTPQEFVAKYQDRFDSCLVLGGGFVYQSFLEADLIDEIYLTIEPVNHKDGVSFLKKGSKIEDYTNGCKPEVEILNSRGTKLFHYTIE